MMTPCDMGRSKLRRSKKTGRIRSFMSLLLSQDRESSHPGARSALALLLLINLFNYIDRQVLSALISPIKRTFFGQNGAMNAAGSDSLAGAIHWFQSQLGFKPEDALLGLLGTAFMLTYIGSMGRYLLELCQRRFRACTDLPDASSYPVFCRDRRSGLWTCGAGHDFRYVSH
jgi:hypothetical protein